MVKKLVFTGGPCGGKTTALAVISERLAKRGFYPLIVPEAATLLMGGNVKPLHWKSAHFQSHVIATAKQLEKHFLLAALQRLDMKPVLLCDRGLADSMAYSSPKDYLAALKENEISSHVAARDQYAAVFHLVTAAKGAEAFYTLSTNKERTETPEQARALDERTLSAWMGTPHLRAIDNSTGFDEKISRLDKEVCAALGIPVPLEIEKKFLIDPVDITKLPKNAQTIDIEQIYLISSDPSTGVRIRKRGQFGTHFYTRTEKREIRPGVRTEIEELISKSEYEHLALLRNPRKKVLHKHRICFMFEHQYFELDVIPRAGQPLYLLEIELTDENKKVSVPPFVHVIRDVTLDSEYTNAALAENM